MSKSQKLRADIEARRERVAAFLLARLSEREMARQLGCSLGTVNGDVKAVRAGWKARHEQAIDDHVADVTAELDALHGVVWPQALAGKLFAVDRLLAIQERRAALLGLDAPKRLAVGGDPANQTPILLRQYAGVELPATASDGGDAP